MAHESRTDKNVKLLCDLLALCRPKLTCLSHGARATERTRPYYVKAVRADNCVINIFVAHLIYRQSHSSSSIVIINIQTIELVADCCWIAAVIEYVKMRRVLVGVRERERRVERQNNKVTSDRCSWQSKVHSWNCHCLPAAHFRYTLNANLHIKSSIVLGTFVSAIVNAKRRQKKTKWRLIMYSVSGSGKISRSIHPWIHAVAHETFHFMHATCWRICSSRRLNRCNMHAKQQQKWSASKFYSFGTNAKFTMQKMILFYSASQIPTERWHREQEAAS